MSTALSPANAALPARLSQPLGQARAFFAQPAVKRAMPLVLLIGLIGAAALAWATLATPPQRILYADLTDADKQAMVTALDAGNIKSHIDSSGALTVGEDDFHKARMLLAAQDLPKAAPGGYAILDQLPMGVSRAVEGERLRQARETELARSIGEIDSVADARVHLAMPESSVFVRDNAAPSASVMVRLQAGRSLSDAQVRSIVNLVASSVPGMKPDAVTIVDQMGALLSKSADGGDGVDDARIDFQRRVEDKYRTQLVQLLTPLVGAGNFTTEVQADVDMDESSATRESYDKQGAVRAEQGNWTGGAREAAPGGIPGALSNTPPPAATLAAAQPGQPGQPATPAQPAAAGATAPAAPSDAAKTSDSFQRTYDLGREVSVTRGMPGGIKRLSVAVLLRDPDGRPRSKLEVQQITQLVQAAVGYNPTRQDQVTVISRRFSPEPAPELQTSTKWYQGDWVPIAARNGTALLIALLVLLLGVRPLTKALLKKREDAAAPAATSPIGAGPAAPPISADQIGTQGEQSYEERIGLVRGFTRENPARAALAVRDMIRSDES